MHASAKRLSTAFSTVSTAEKLTLDATAADAAAALILLITLALFDQR